MALLRPNPAFIASLAALLVLAIYWCLSWTPPVLLDQTSNSITYTPAVEDSSESIQQHQASEAAFADNTHLSITWQAPTHADHFLPSEPYTRELVLAKLSEEDTSWTNSLSDLLLPSGNLNLSIYVVDDPRAPLHPPANKGHEAMVYFTYIIDRYYSLPDISILMHGHSNAWHNNDLLNASSAALVRHLNPNRVRREGYMNLRCHWHPGCRDWMHPASKTFDNSKKEQQVIATVWAELFDDPVPAVLAAPCCSQFAVSRDCLLKHPRDFYERMRDWILSTDLPDHESGRVFEYFWQYIFANEMSLCPHPRICYCDGYGICFENDETFESFFRVQARNHRYWEEIKKWRKQRDAYEEAQRLGNLIVPVAPDPDAEERLLEVTRQTEQEMARLKRLASGLGNDAGRRAVLVQMALDQIGEEKDWVDVSHKEFDNEEEL